MSDFAEWFNEHCVVSVAELRRARLEGNLGELRRRWLLWSQVDPAAEAARDRELPPELLDEADGDSVVAWTAFRAGVLAQLAVLGDATAVRLADERRSA